MAKELTLEILDKLIQETKEEIVGFVVSPSDGEELKNGSKQLWGCDDYKIFVMPPYTGLPIYVSHLVKDGQPIKLTKKHVLKLGGN